MKNVGMTSLTRAHPLPPPGKDIALGGDGRMRLVVPVPPLATSSLVVLPPDKEGK